MKKIYANRLYNLNIYDVSTSIIFNDEKLKKKILEQFPKNDFTLINCSYISYDKSVRSFLKEFNFDMKFVPYFNLEGLMSKKIHSLDLETYVFIKILAYLTITDKVLVFDDVLTFLTDSQKNKVISYMKKNKIVFVNFTSDVDETIFAPYLIVLDCKDVAIEGATVNVLKEEKILKHLGFNLPFALNLSLQLMAYGIVEKEYFSVIDLVGALWK